ncbi:unnamed protein product [Ceutorhynchus assimilis]|uniref:Uncharacterized protein n=1 Tax=Ceutorhynchus assimilis TaxID=467358 RepID=A0A9N9MJR9_9CUCU|nr:unnamed protein product [Ceutorhynchus assimilis]
MATRAAKILKLLSSEQKNSLELPLPKYKSKRDCTKEKRLMAYKDEPLVGGKEIVAPESTNQIFEQSLQNTEQECYVNEPTCIEEKKQNNCKSDDYQTEEELFESSGSEYIPDTTDHDETDENSNISLLSQIVMAIPEENESSFTCNRGIENRNISNIGNEANSSRGNKQINNDESLPSNISTLLLDLSSEEKVFCYLQNCKETQDLDPYEFSVEGPVDKSYNNIIEKSLCYLPYLDIVDPATIRNKKEKIISLTKDNEKDQLESAHDSQLISPNAETMDLTNQTMDLTNQTMDLTNQTMDLTNQTMDLTNQTMDLPNQTMDLPNQVQITNNSESIENKATSICITEHATRFNVQVTDPQIFTAAITSNNSAVDICALERENPEANSCFSDDASDLSCNENSDESYKPSSYQSNSSIDGDGKDSNNMYSDEDQEKLISTIHFPTTSTSLENTEANTDKDLCPFCFEEVGHFSRHLKRKHSEEDAVKKILEMKNNSNERRAAIIALRKKGNFILKTEKNFLKPVRKVKNRNQIDGDYYPCTGCLGYYKKTYLWRHKKICTATTSHNKDGPKVQHLIEAQTFLAATGLLGNYLEKSRLKAEVFPIMRADEISYTAKKDALICLYGESYLNKHKRKQMTVVTSNRLREIARLKLALQKFTTIENCIDFLKPEMYDNIITASKLISGFNSETKTFKSSSLALHLGTNLKFLCDVAKKALITRNPLFPRLTNTEKYEKLKDISEVRDLIKNHWCNDISSLANKVLNEVQLEKPKLLPLTEDIKCFNNYISTKAIEAYEKLQEKENVTNNYKLLAECTLCLVLVFNRKRIGEIQFLDIQSYEKDYSCSNSEEFLNALTEFEKNMSSCFKRVVVFGKGSKPVPILFTKQMQTYIGALLKIRKDYDIVPKTNKKQIATILQLMNFENDEMEQIARFMGHTEKTHREFYRLTEDIYQTAKVAKVLILLNAGKGNEFKGKSLTEIEVNQHVLEYDDTDDLCDKLDNIESNQPVATLPLTRADSPSETTDSMSENKAEVPKTTSKKSPGANVSKLRGGRVRWTQQDKNRADSPSETTDLMLENTTEVPKTRVNKLPEANFSKLRGGRVRWTQADKNLVLNYFKKNIKGKFVPRKQDCLDFIRKNSSSFKDSDWLTDYDWLVKDGKLKPLWYVGNPTPDAVEGILLLNEDDDDLNGKEVSDS